MLIGLTVSDVPKVCAEDFSPYTISNGSIALPLTQMPGNPDRGRQLVRDLGHVSCLICHVMPISEEPDHGNIGPSLVGVGNRLTIGELRLRLVEPRVLNPDTVMPSYYRIKELYRVGESFREKPIYTAQDVEDVVSYLAQLKDR
jgi:sulfur-oxidizing protein SoxX